MKRRSSYEVLMSLWLKDTHPVPEYPFAKELGRRWRLDFAWPVLRLGVEVDGGARLVRWQRNPRTGRSQPVAVGRHGTAEDYEKLNAAAILGWRILRFNPEMMRRPMEVLETVRKAMQACLEDSNLDAQASGAFPPLPRTR